MQRRSTFAPPEDYLGQSIHPLTAVPVSTALLKKMNMLQSFAAFFSPKTILSIHNQSPGVSPGENYTPILITTGSNMFCLQSYGRTRARLYPVYTERGNEKQIRAP